MTPSGTAVGLFMLADLLLDEPLSALDTCLRYRRRRPHHRMKKNPRPVVWATIGWRPWTGECHLRVAIFPLEHRHLGIRAHHIQFSIDAVMNRLDRAAIEKTKAGTTTFTLGGEPQPPDHYRYAPLTNVE